MLSRFNRWALLLVAVMSFGFILTACGDQSAPSAGQATVSTGVNSTLATSFADNTTVYLSLNTDSNSSQSKSWQKVIDYLSAIPEVKDALSQIDLLQQAKIASYDADVKPWLGSEVAIGLTDVNALLNLVGSMQSSTGSATPTTPSLSSLSGGILPQIVLSVTDRTKAEAFITKLNTQLQNQGLPTPTVDTSNANFKLWNYNLMILSLEVGLSDNKLVIANTVDQVKAAFARPTDTSLKNLAGTDSYKAIATKLPTSNSIFAYLDDQALIKSLNSNAQLKQATGNMNLAGLDYTAAIGFTVSTADEGLRTDVYQTYLTDKIPPAQADILKKSANQSNILKVLPETTLFFANLRDAASSYDVVINTLKSSGSVPDFDKKLADFEQQSGLSVRNDIVSLFNGEFAVFGTPDTTNQSFPFGIGIVSETTDRAATQAKLKKIADAIAKNSDGKITWQDKAPNGTVSYSTATYTQDNTKVSLNLGVAGNYAFFIVGDKATSDTIAAIAGSGKNFTTGANVANFNKVKDVLPSGNSGYVYLDAQSTINQVLQALPADKATDTKKYTDKLTKLYAGGAATSYNVNSNNVVDASRTTAYLYFPVTK